MTKRGKILVTLTGLFLMVWVVGAAYQTYQAREFARKNAEFQREWERPLREDNVGGKTPEETWAMFMAALKSGDFEKASGYVYFEKRAGFKEDVEAMSKERLAEWIKELGTLKKDVVQDYENEASYTFTYYNEKYKMVLGSSVILKLNQFTKIWKITVI